MEDKIKALIEKYEKELWLTQALHDAATDYADKQYYKCGIGVLSSVISDLK